MTPVIRHTAVLITKPGKDLERWVGPLATIQNGGNLNRMVLTLYVSDASLRTTPVAFERSIVLHSYTKGVHVETVHFYQPLYSISPKLIERLENALSKNWHWRKLSGGTATTYRYGEQRQ